jgi:hypothetical protein
MGYDTGLLGIIFTRFSEGGLENTLVQEMLQQNRYLINPPPLLLYHVSFLKCCIFHIATTLLDSVIVWLYFVLPCGWDGEEDVNNLSF